MILLPYTIATSGTFYRLLFTKREEDDCLGRGEGEGLGRRGWGWGWEHGVKEAWDKPALTLSSGRGRYPPPELRQVRMVPQSGKDRKKARWSVHINVFKVCLAGRLSAGGFLRVLPVCSPPPSGTFPKNSIPNSVIAELTLRTTWLHWHCLNSF